MSTPKDETNSSPILKQRSSFPIETDPEFLQELVQLQREQIAIWKEEISAQKQRVQYAHEYSLKNLEVMSKDKADYRAHNKTDRRDRMLFAALTIICLIGFLTASIYLGQAEIAKEMAKSVGLLIVGAFGGYSYGIRKVKGAENN